MILFHDTDVPSPINERDGLHRHLARTIPKPTLLSTDAYAALSSPDRDTYNRARVLFLSGGILINTGAVKRATADVIRMFAENLAENAANTGLMLSGDSTLGKTTITKVLMKYIFAMYKRQYPEFEANRRTPVVYVEVPAGCTAKLLMVAFARFFGITVARSDTADTIKHRVVQALNTARTQLVVVDELHNLSANNRGNGESVAVLKLLHDEVPATFVYAGIDLSDGALLAGLKGQQLTGRFVKTDLTRFNLSDADQAKDWRGVIMEFERSLLLADHIPGTLLKLSTYLRERTGGSIGSLGRLLTGVAIDLIINPHGRPEAITKELLDAHPIDMAAESAYAHRPVSTQKKATS